MAASLHITSIVVLALLASFASAYDHSPLQDFCVAVPDAQAAVFVNGKICKNPKLVKADDFYLAARLNAHAGNPKNTSSGVSGIFVNVDTFPGLNTMDLSFGRIDFAPNGLTPLPPSRHRGCVCSGRHTLRWFCDFQLQIQITIKRIRFSPKFSTPETPSFFLGDLFTSSVTLGTPTL